MGITGANFVVAETGTLVIVTNEGNGRMCTSTPRIHVALTGMEKLLPSLEDLAIFLRLLPRAATGQHITSYVSFVNGPRRPGDEDGPEEFHLILVDNGRLKMLQDPELREALYCIRCGACLNICPIYRNVGGHAYGWVYPGPIGAVVTPNLVGLPKAKDLPFASSLCGACREVCPIKINIPHMLLHLRHKLSESNSEKERKTSLDEVFFAKAFTFLMGSPRVLNLAHKLGRVFQWPFEHHGKIQRIPVPPFSVWTKSKDLTALPPKSFHDIWEQELSKEQQ
jgi:L-lactate dehydrogenase complex protein LldF